MCSFFKTVFAVTLSHRICDNSWQLQKSNFLFQSVPCLHRFTDFHFLNYAVKAGIRSIILLLYGTQIERWVNWTMLKSCEENIKALLRIGLAVIRFGPHPAETKEKESQYIKLWETATRCLSFRVRCVAVWRRSRAASIDVDIGRETDWSVD